MEYKVLSIGIEGELNQRLKKELAQENTVLIQAMDILDGIGLWSKQDFSLIVTNLRELEQGKQVELLTGLRRMRFAPILALIDYRDKDLFAHSLDSGVDVCQPYDLPPSLLSKQVKALLRRYMDYNHCDQASTPETAPFQCGDIFIDPLRHIVKVRGCSVQLRPREFDMLLYFMRNPHIILTDEQICTNAWGMEGGYNRGVSQPIYLLRQAIEPEPENPIYIETVRRVGYRFTAHNSETCEQCDGTVSVL